MEEEKQLLQEVVVGNVEGSGGSSKGQGGLACGRQSSSRWTPTSDQIRILKELYYNNGVRSPSADQIQRISARLRQYGKIEGKNVFYWFQNHKARERQKKRFTSSSSTTNSNSSDHHLITIPSLPKQSSSILPNINNSSNIISPPPLPLPLPPAPSSSVMLAVGHMGHYGSYASATVENSFRDCSISSGGSSGLMGSRMGWIGVDPYSAQAASGFFEKTKSVEESMEDGGQEIETLPLFPIHGDRNLGAFCSMKPEYSDGYYATAWYGRPDEGAAAASRASLELSLNSYAAISPDDA